MSVCFHYIFTLILARYTCGIMESTVKEAILRFRGGGGGNPALPVKGEGHPDSPRDLTKLCGAGSLGITRKGTLHSSWTQTKSRQCHVTRTSPCHYFEMYSCWWQPCACSAAALELLSLLQDESQNCRNVWGGSNIVMQVSKPINYFTTH